MARNVAPNFPRVSDVYGVYGVYVLGGLTSVPMFPSLPQKLISGPSGMVRLEQEMYCRTEDCTEQTTTVASASAFLQHAAVCRSTFCLCEFPCNQIFRACKGRERTLPCFSKKGIKLIFSMTLYLTLYLTILRRLTLNIHSKGRLPELKKPVDRRLDDHY